MYHLAAPFSLNLKPIYPNLNTVETVLLNLLRALFSIFSCKPRTSSSVMRAGGKWKTTLFYDAFLKALELNTHCVHNKPKLCTFKWVVAS